MATKQQLHSSAKKFLDKNPTKIGTLMGYDFYEDPILGEDGFMLAITPYGTLRRSCFYEMMDEEDLEYQISEWNKKVLVFTTRGMGADFKNRAIVVNSLTGELLFVVPTHQLTTTLNGNGLTPIRKPKELEFADFERVLKNAQEKVCKV